MKGHGLSPGALKGLGSYSAWKLRSYPIIVLWMLAEDRLLGQKQRTSWQSKQNEHQVHMGAPYPSGPTGEAQRGQVDVKRAVGLHHTRGTPSLGNPLLLQ